MGYLEPDVKAGVNPRGVDALWTLEVVGWMFSLSRSEIAPAQPRLFPAANRTHRSADVVGPLFVEHKGG